MQRREELFAVCTAELEQSKLEPADFLKKLTYENNDFTDNFTKFYEPTLAVASDTDSSYAGFEYSQPVSFYSSNHSNETITSAEQIPPIEPIQLASVCFQLVPPNFVKEICSVQPIVIIGRIPLNQFCEANDLVEENDTESDEELVEDSDAEGKKYRH